MAFGNRLPRGVIDYKAQKWIQGVEMASGNQLPGLEMEMGY